ncbi:Rha family phage regulatory protein [Paraburkholderia sp. CI2]|uniref:Rha family transcriptional regulator n=1 Tax=Paraburkholderia sp. CI2 TaxID=2723093 RepID=UPI00160DF5A4|nr:Rha family transcriptional regulator [Paraburkholderia sp. CI2]MBB5467237.1 Rha family phage regulatory protein [Paraburkholderia sp. CI2]
MATTSRNEKGRGSDKHATQPTTTAGNDTALAEIVHLRGGVPVTDSLTIAREFGRRHDNVMRTLDSLIADGTIDGLNFEETSYTDESNRQQRMIELDERGALIAMPFIGGRNSRAGQVRLVDAFLSLRDNGAQLEESDALSTVLDRLPLYKAADEMMAKHGLSLPRAYRMLCAYAGVVSFAQMTRRHVVAALRFAWRYLSGSTTPADFERIEHNRVQLGGEPAQLPLIGSGLLAGGA